MDDAAVSALRIAFEAANRWAGISALVVAVGVFIELIVLFVFSKEISRLEKSMLVIATAMIVLGVLGEWWYGGEAATESETLQSDATTKAANANRDAQTAIARAAALEINAAQLRADNLALEKQIAPRRLTPADLATLVTIIRQHPGQQIAIESYALDVEAAILGEQLIQMLRAGNFPFDDRRMTVAALGGAIIGIRLTGTNQVFSSDLRQAFRSFGFELVLAEEPPPVTGITSGNPFAPAPVNIFIGVKPIRQ